MPIEEQVCSLELAKKLKGLGVPQDSVFYWRDRLMVSQQLAKLSV